MIGPLILLFIVLPLVDILLLIHVAGHIGLLNTALLVVLTGVIGASLVKREGITILTRIQYAVYMDEMGQAVVEGALLTGGGLLLLSPGVITDALGFAFVVPHTRQSFARYLRTRMEESDNVVIEYSGVGPGYP